jgi:DNA-binding transcriptional regulator PaaX
MRREDIVPFGEFLDYMDRPTATFQPTTQAEREADRRGEFRGEWHLLWQLRELEHRGETDLRTALNKVEAGLLALKRRRSPRDFWTALERAAEKDTTSEGECP